MARLIVIDPDPRLRRSLVELLRAGGHSVQSFEDLAAALAVDSRVPPDLAFLAMGPGGEAAEPAWAALGGSAAPPIVWTGPLR